MVDGTITENVFELLAAIVLDALVLARVLFYVIAKKRKEFPGRIVMLSGITLLQVVILVRKAVLKSCSGAAIHCTSCPARRGVASEVTCYCCLLLPQFLTCWTILQFGWRIFSRQAVDYRKKDAKERMRLYLSRAMFLTVEKLDFQFLVSCKAL